MTRYGIAVDYDYGETHKRDYITIWSGAFSSDFEGQAYPTRGAKQITITLDWVGKVVVKLPDGVTFPRTDENYEAIDAAINEQLNAFFDARRAADVTPDLPPGDDGTPLIDDVPAPGADEDHREEVGV